MDVCTWRAAISLCAVLVLIGDGFEPDGLALCSGCDRDIGEAVAWCCAVPVLDAGSAFDYIRLGNDANRLSAFLVVAGALGDEQNLTAWMDMPVQFCTCVVGCHGDAGIERAVADVEFTEPDVPSVALGVRQL